MAETAVPQTDKALLEAQAKAGQAGLDAYEAAKAELSANKTNTLDSAMSAAQSRGASGAASEQTLAGAEGIYNQRANSMTAAEAAYRDAMSSREARANDYSTAIQGSRGLIADQAFLAAAPIKAQSDFNVAQIQQQGRQNVSGIEAEQAAWLARFEMEERLRQQQLAEEAAARAAAGSGGGGGGGGGGSNNLTYLELQAMAGGAAPGYVEAAHGGVTDAVAQTTNRQELARTQSGADTIRARADRKKEDERRAMIQTALFDAVQKTGGKPSKFQQQIIDGYREELGMMNAAAPTPNAVPDNVSPLPPSVQAGRDKIDREWQPEWDRRQEFREARDIAAPFFSQGNLQESPFWGGDLNFGAEGPDAPGSTLPESQQGLLQSVFDMNPDLDVRNPQDIASAFGDDPEVMRRAFLGATGDLVEQGGYGVTPEVLARAMGGNSAFTLGDTYNDTAGRIAGVGDVEDQEAAGRTARSDSDLADLDAVQANIDEYTDLDIDVESLSNSTSAINEAVREIANDPDQWALDEENARSKTVGKNAAGEETYMSKQSLTDLLTGGGMSPARAELLAAAIYG